ncbi:hypothetical protein [Streptomyces sp. NPDC002088]
MTNLSKEHNPAQRPSNGRLLLRSTLEVLFRIACVAAGFGLAHWYFNH